MSKVGLMKGKVFVTYDVTSDADTTNRMSVEEYNNWKRNIRDEVRVMMNKAAEHWNGITQEALQLKFPGVLFSGKIVVTDVEASFDGDGASVGTSID